MDIRIKMKKTIVVLLILSCISFLLGLILIAKSGQAVVKRIKYEESAGIDYKVYINDNTNYNQNYLDEGMQYITEIIDKIEITSKYKIRYSEKINVNFNSVVNADIKILDEANNKKVIYQNKEELKTKKTIKKDIDSYIETNTINIDYQKYNKFVNSFKTKHNIPAHCKLIITFETSQSNDEDYAKSIKKNKTMVVEIPLSQRMITINKPSYSKTKSSFVTSTSIPYKNILLIVVAIALFIITFIFLLSAISIWIKRNRITSDYDKFIEKILRQYDAYITESSGTIELKEDTIYVKSFKELLDVRNNVEKAIVYNKVTNDKSIFVVVDNEQEYCYTATKDNFIE